MPICYLDHFCSRESIRSQTPSDSYFVTELLGTDLHRLLTSRPLEKQFIQYFLYQILVGRASLCAVCSAYPDPADVSKAWLKIRTLRRGGAPRSEAE